MATDNDKDTSMAKAVRSVRVFSSSYRKSSGLVTALMSYAREIRKDRWQIWMTFKRRFKSSYNTTVFGIFWAVALPVVPIGAYVLLASMRVVTTVDDMPFVIYIALGVTFYTFCTTPISETMSAVDGEKTLLSKSNVGVFSVILGRFGSIAFETLVRLVLIVVLMLIFGGLPQSWSSLLFIPLLCMVFISMLSVGLLLSIFNAIATDVEKVVSVILRFGLFFSGVFFPLPKENGIGIFLNFNPFYTYVDALRQLLVFGSLPDPMLLLVTSSVCTFIFCIALTAFYRCEPHIRAAV